MKMAGFSTLVSGFDFLESPRWHEGRLWFSDFYLHRVFAADMDGRTETIAEVKNQPSGLGWLPDGRMLVVSMRDKKILRQENDGTLALHADLSDIAGGFLNDMVVDEKGRAYAGNFGFDLMSGAPLETANLALVYPDGSKQVAATDMYFPNGSMITPDGKTLIVNETFANRISAFDIKDDGTLGPRRDWATFGPLPQGRELAELMPQARVAPDGGCLDAEGAVWIADAIGNRVLRVEEGGRILDEISTGESGVFACTLGGPDRKTLFLCIAPDFSEHSRKGSHGASMWTIPVDTPGAGMP